jgi:hypothetical protein
MGELAPKATLLRIAQLEERARAAEIALKAARDELAARDGMGTRYAEMYAEREGLLERLERLRGQVPRELVHVERGVNGEWVVRQVWSESGRSLIVDVDVRTGAIEVTTGGDADVTADEAETLAAVLMWAARVSRGEDNGG